MLMVMTVNLAAFAQCYMAMAQLHMAWEATVLRIPLYMIDFCLKQLIHYKEIKEIERWERERGTYMKKINWIPKKINEMDMLLLSCSSPPHKCRLEGLETWINCIELLTNSLKPMKQRGQFLPRILVLLHFYTRSRKI